MDTLRIRWCFSGCQRPGLGRRTCPVCIGCCSHPSRYVGFDLPLTSSMEQKPGDRCGGWKSAETSLLASAAVRRVYAVISLVLKMKLV